MKTFNCNRPTFVLFLHENNKLSSHFRVKEEQTRLTPCHPDRTPCHPERSEGFTHAPSARARAVSVPDLLKNRASGAGTLTGTKRQIS